MNKFLKRLNDIIKVLDDINKIKKVSDNILIKAFTNISKKYFTYKISSDDMGILIRKIYKYLFLNCKGFKNICNKIKATNGRNSFKIDKNSYTISPGKYYFIFKNTLMIFEYKISTYLNIDNYPTNHKIINIQFVGMKNDINYIKNEFINLLTDKEYCDYINRTFIYDKISDNNNSRTNRISINSLRIEPLDKESLFIEKLDEIDEFVDNWIKKKDVYKKHNIKFKQGVFLYGEPGTGKTTIAKYIASKIFKQCTKNIKIESVNIGTMSVAGLEEYINSITFSEEEQKTNVEYNSDLITVILFDDADCGISKRHNDIDKKSPQEIESEKKLNMLLGFLDGMDSPNNVLFVVTTNHIDIFDKAFYRDGRFDLVIEIPSLTEETARKMIKSYDLDPDEVLKMPELESNNNYKIATIRKACMKYLK